MTILPAHAVNGTIGVGLAIPTTSKSWLAVPTPHAFVAVRLILLFPTPKLTSGGVCDIEPDGVPPTNVQEYIIIGDSQSLISACGIILYWLQNGPIICSSSTCGGAPTTIVRRAVTVPQAFSIFSIISYLPETLNRKVGAVAVALPVTNVHWPSPSWQFDPSNSTTQL